MIDLLLLMLVPALKAVDGGSRHPGHVAAAVFAGLLDILICHTTWRKLAGKPLRGEWTISKTLERLCHPDNVSHPEYDYFVSTARMINRRSPTGKHIKVLL